MKKTKKRILGLLGLILVIVTTVFAMFLPNPNASAMGPNTVTDIITVKVIGETPSVNITSPIESGQKFVKAADIDLSFGYENIERAAITISYTDKDNNMVTYEAADLVIDDVNGDNTLNLESIGALRGYGEYVVTVRGYGSLEGVYDEDSTEFLFYPVYGEAYEDKDDGLTYLDLTYDTENEDIKKIVVKIYDENGNLVESISPITVTPPDTKVELPFSEKDLASGKYVIRITAYGADDEALYKYYTTSIDYEMEVVPVPDTGAIFEKLNISKADYLISSLLIFFTVAIIGIVFVFRDRNRKASIKRSN